MARKRKLFGPLLYGTLIISGVVVDGLTYATVPFEWGFHYLFHDFELDEEMVGTNAVAVPDIHRRWSKLEKQMLDWFPSCTGYSVRRQCFGGPFGLSTLVDEHVQRFGISTPAFRTIRSGVESLAFDPSANDQPMLRGYSFIMARDGYVGFVLGEPKVGDVLYVAYGSYLPLVLRSVEGTNSTYAFVGCALV